MAWGSLDYKNDIGRIELIVEGQNNGNKNVFSGESNFKKLRRHMRLKAKAYGRYNTVPGKPYVLEVTAHIDFFPIQRLHDLRKIHHEKAKIYFACQIRHLHQQKRREIQSKIGKRETQREKMARGTESQRRQMAKKLP